MYGFCLVLGDKERIIGENESRSFEKEMSWEGIHAGFNPMPRFERDKLFFQDDEKLVILDGVVFNNHELMEKYGVENWETAFSKLYAENKETFVDSLRGSFCGVVVDKNLNEIVAFSNHTGERPMYYMLDDEGKCKFIATHVNFIEEQLAQNDERLSANIEAAYQLLITGSCLGHNTPFNNMFRITAGKLIRVSAGRDVTEGFYHLFKNTPEMNKPNDEYIEESDRLFRQAIKRIYGKNQEYGYDSECDLSGGLDSRMATYVAHDMGFKNILNMCYCVKGKIDNTTSEKIAHDLGNRYSFLHMNGNVFLDVDEITNRVGGQVFYGVGTGSLRSLKQIDTSNIGMCVTGLLGEFIKGDLALNGKHTPVLSEEATDCRYSKFYPISVPKSHNDAYENHEQLNIYEHGANLIISSAIVRQQTCEVTSPFWDVDYVDYIFRIPINVRNNGDFEVAWIVKKYPGAAKYIWQSKKMSVEDWVNGKKHFSINTVDFIKRAANYAFRKLNIPFRFYRINDMNPIDTWYYRNGKFRSFLKDYYAANIEAVKESQLKTDIVKMFKEGKPIDKLMVVNYLGVYKRYLADAK